MNELLNIIKSNDVLKYEQIAKQDNFSTLLANTQRQLKPPLFIYVIYLKASIPMLEALRKSGVDIYAEDEYRDNALVVSLNLRLTDVFLYLLTFDFNVDYILPVKGYSILQYAAIRGNLIAVKELIRKGANVNFVEVSGNTTIYYLCMLISENEMYVEIIKELLSVSNIDVNLRNENSVPAFFHLSMLDMYNTTFEEFEFLLKKFIEHGFDINQVFRNENVIGIISKLVYEENIYPYIEILLKNGADVNSMIFSQEMEDNDEDENPIENNQFKPLLLFFIDHIELVKLLVSYGADVNMVLENGATPIFMTDDKEVLNFLIKSGANINYEKIVIKDGIEYKLTPLFFHWDKTSLRNFFLMKGAKITEEIKKMHNNSLLLITIDMLDKMNDEKIRLLFFQDHCFWMKMAKNYNKNAYPRFINIYQSMVNIPNDTIEYMVDYECD